MEEPCLAGGCLGKVSPNRRVSFAPEGPEWGAKWENYTGGEASRETSLGEGDCWSVKLFRNLGL